MAASAENKDIAHLSSAGLHLPLNIIPARAAELDPQGSGPAVVQQISSSVTPETLVVIELGDNVQQPGDLAAFVPVYRQMTEAASKGAGLICLSTWGDYTATDQAVESARLAHGGTYIFIGDIFSDPQNPDYQGPPVYSNPTVNNHPHDWSMQQIANRVITGGEHLAVPVIAPIQRASCGAR